MFTGKGRDFLVHGKRIVPKRLGGFPHSVQWKWKQSAKSSSIYIGMRERAKTLLPLPLIEAYAAPF